MTEQTNLFDSACLVIAQALVSHSPQEEWASLVLSTPVLSHGLGGVTTLCLDKNGRETDIPIGFSIFDIQKAVLCIRENVLHMTGDRIWGLTFTLYPTGKFNLEYDYNKPENYEEEGQEGIDFNDALEQLKQLGIPMEIGRKKQN